MCFAKVDSLRQCSESVSKLSENLRKFSENTRKPSKIIVSSGKVSEIFEDSFKNLPKSSKRFMENFENF